MQLCRSCRTRDSATSLTSRRSWEGGAGTTLSGYSASKFALIGFTESLRMELFGSGLIASLMVPISVDTEMLDNPDWNSRAWAVGNLEIPPDC